MILELAATYCHDQRLNCSNSSYLKNQDKKRTYYQRSCRRPKKSGKKTKDWCYLCQAENKIDGIPEELRGDKCSPSSKLPRWLWESWLRFLHLLVCIYKTVTYGTLKCAARFTCQVLEILEREEPSEVSHHLTADTCKIFCEPTYRLLYGFHQR